MTETGPGLLALLAFFAMPFLILHYVRPRDDLFERLQLTVMTAVHAYHHKQRRARKAGRPVPPPSLPSLETLSRLINNHL